MSSRTRASFFDGECATGRATGVGRPVGLTARATEMGRRTVERVTTDGFTDSLPSGRYAPSRNSHRRISPEELARGSTAVHAWHYDRANPTLYSTLEHLRTEIFVLSWTDTPSSYKWARTTLIRAFQEIGFSFSQGPNHYDAQKSAVEAGAREMSGRG